MTKANSKTAGTSGQMNPLPSLIRASAWDAANARMRKAGRSKWTRGDYNEAAATQERLTRACYAMPTDDNPSLAYIRFGIAEAMQRNGQFHLKSPMPAIYAAIEATISAA